MCIASCGVTSLDNVTSESFAESPDSLLEWANCPDPGDNFPLDVICNCTKVNP